MRIRCLRPSRAAGRAGRAPCLRLRTSGFAALLLLLVRLPGAASLEAAEKRLYWRSLDVEATLDAEGRLQVSEVHVMVFTGDWNGGERTFRIGFGQDLDFKGLSRTDPGSGGWRALGEGSLERVDHYEWVDSRTLRWRSRLPSDPPFDETALSYRIEYTLSDILVRRGEAYWLDHDFAFPDREWPILAFSVDLRIDPVWQRPEPFQARLNKGRLEPGESVVLTLPLHYGAAGKPAGVAAGAPPLFRYLLLALYFTAAIAFSASFLRHERSRGRFEPLLPVSAVTESWLEENVLGTPPEVVGAAWDDTTAAPEVAAVLARLVAEGKIESEIRRGGRFFGRDELHLRLLARRDGLLGHERKLIDALFFANDRTDTKSIRRHYSKTGFSPAEKIRESLEKRVQGLLGPSGQGGAGVSWKGPAALGLAGAALIALASVLRPGELAVGLAGLAAAFVTLVLAAIEAPHYRRGVAHPRLRLFSLASPLLLLGAALAWFLVSDAFRSSLPLAAGLTLVSAAVTGLALALATTRESRERMGLRKRLASARKCFQQELKKPHPDLRDSWFPYLIAFGLGRDVSRWFKDYGASGLSSPALASPAGPFGGGPSGSRGWTGGGGSFGGAGATAAWAAAAGSLASGVPSPGSSGSGGGGGGSSGGGGGGGW
ncbi:MAG: hypothetical protein AB1640_04810 [bacterium]